MVIAPEVLNTFPDSIRVVFRKGRVLICIYNNKCNILSNGFQGLSNVMSETIVDNCHKSKSVYVMQSWISLPWYANNYFLLHSIRTRKMSRRISINSFQDNKLCKGIWTARIYLAVLEDVRRRHVSTSAANFYVDRQTIALRWNT